MTPPPSSDPADNPVELLLLNAHLWEQADPYLDESIWVVPMDRWPVSTENEYLQSMLAWERAPAIPISQWFEPPLNPPNPQWLEDSEICPLLDRLIAILATEGIELEWADHMNDRQLYTLIVRDILPSVEKKCDLPDRSLRWRCIEADDHETWLSYYATDEERLQWSQEQGCPPPPKREPQFRRPALRPAR
jgi:hypothetical protein